MPLNHDDLPVNKKKPAGGPNGLPAGFFQPERGPLWTEPAFFCEILPLRLDCVSGSAILKTNI